MAESWQIRLKRLPQGRIVVILMAAFLASSLALVLVFAWIGYRSATFGGEPGLLVHPRRAETPFSLTKGPDPAQFAAVINLPIYPGSAAEEAGMRMVSMRPPNSGNEPNLGFLHLRVAENLTPVDSWYQDHLGRDFTRTEGQALALMKVKEESIRLLSKVPEGQAVLFLANRLGTARGVLLEPDGEGRGLLITVFFYGDGGPE